MLIFIFRCQISKCAALQGARFNFLTRQHMCQPITVFLLQHCWGFPYCFSLMEGGGRRLREKVRSHNLNPSILQTAPRIIYSAKELSVLFLFFYPTVSSLQQGVGGEVQFHSCLTSVLDRS